MSVDNVSKQFQQQIEQAAEPVRKLHATMVEHAEKIARFQLEMAQSYTELALNNIREVSALNSVEGVQNYLQNYPKTLQQTSEKIVQDSQKLAQLGQGVGEDLRKLAEENVATATKNVQGAAGKASGSQKKAAA